MSGEVVKLPSAATSFYTIQKAGNRWFVVLVTPCEPKPLRTKLYSCDTKEGAACHAKATATRMQRQFKIGGAA